MSSLYIMKAANSVGELAGVASVEALRHSAVVGGQGHEHAQTGAVLADEAQESHNPAERHLRAAEQHFRAEVYHQLDSTNGYRPTPPGASFYGSPESQEVNRRHWEQQRNAYRPHAFAARRNRQAGIAHAEAAGVDPLALRARAHSQLALEETQRWGSRAATAHARAAVAATPRSYEAAEAQRRAARVFERRHDSSSAKPGSREDMALWRIRQAHYIARESHRPLNHNPWQSVEYGNLESDE